MAVRCRVRHDSTGIRTAEPGYVAWREGLVAPSRFGGSDSEGFRRYGKGMGVLETIWIKRAKLGPMDSVESARLIEGKGLEGNANQGGHRQVTILSADVWESMTDDLGESLDPSVRRANLYVRGVDLEQSRGKTLAIGSVRIRVHGETRPCERMDAARGGLRRVMGASWRGGVFGEVLEGGPIEIGSDVRWAEAD